jgi:phosphate transport system protein
MSIHLQRDLESLQVLVLAQSSVVEEMIRKASRAIRASRPELVDEITRLEQLVDEREVRIEEDCLKILALHQPVAIDLRRTAIILKINNDLERMADLAVNIAERAQNLNRYAEFEVPGTFDRMAQLTILMVKDALNAFVRLDVQAAREVCLDDNQVDDLNREVIDDMRGICERSRN